MELLDRRIAELEALAVPQTKRPDFDDFWRGTLDRVHGAPLGVQGGAVDHPVRSMEVRDLTFDALDGTPIRTWLILPPEAKDGPVPALVCYHGAGGSRGVPSNYVAWAAMGAGAGQPSLAVLGLTGRREWYRYHAVTDSLLAYRLARETPEIDADRVCVTGGSQGGGMSLTVAALEPSVALCMADVPSACWLEKRLYDRAGGYGKIAEFLRRHPDRVDEVCATLSYFDNINLADRIRCPVLISLGLKDPVCPPENVYAAANKISSEKELCVYPFGEHDGGGQVHVERKLAFFRRHMLTARGKMADSI